MSLSLWYASLTLCYFSVPVSVAAIKLGTNLFVDKNILVSLSMHKFNLYYWLDYIPQSIYEGKSLLSTHTPWQKPFNVIMAVRVKLLLGTLCCPLNTSVHFNCIPCSTLTDLLLWSTSLKIYKKLKWNFKLISINDRKYTRHETLPGTYSSGVYNDQL